MEFFFLIVLIVLMASALGSGFPVAFALPGSAIITILLAGFTGFIFESNPSAYFHSSGPYEWLSAGVTNLRGVYWEPERDTLIAIPLFIFMGLMLQRSKVAEDLLLAMAQLFGPVPGGLGISVVFVGALLAATTGIVGATVVATASSSESAKQCKAAGADLVVDHPSSKTSRDILDYTNGQKINRIIEGDFGVNLLPALDILSNNGIIATYSSMTDMNPKIPFLRMMFMDLTIRMVLVYIMPKDAKQKAINDITLLLKQNKLDNRVAEVFSLEDSANAHEAIEKGNNFGSVIIRV